jgi:protein-S-isoprenylcysteine O-methyltransferase Ste14
MRAPDLRIYIVDACFWLAFVIGDIAARSVRRRGSVESPSPAIASAEEPLRAVRANVVLAAHMVAFALLYGGIGQAVFGSRGHPLPALSPLVGALVILAGGVLAGWARLSFASWRFRAQLDAGHQLATGGPFRIVRHPIYAALDLLALGSALWYASLVIWLGAMLMAVTGDLRARAEEPLLEQAFGDEYRAYRGRTRRFIPGVY